MDNNELEKQNQLENIASKNCILRVVAGSHAYGTNLPSSDWDERGIFADIKERIILPFEKIEQVKFIKDDIVFYELTKYMTLLLEQNPNILEILWADEKDILEKSKMGDLLIEHRKDFLSKKITDSYVGYATSQLKRIKGHNKWINNPQPEREPQMIDFVSVVWNYSNNKHLNKHIDLNTQQIGLNLGDSHIGLWSKENSFLRNNNLNLRNWFDNKGNPVAYKKEELYEILEHIGSPEQIVKINRQAYMDHHDNWRNYWTWKKNRNDKRSELEEKYGYDTKHAMHLIRLLRSGIDILEKGVVPVKRDDAQYLLSIRSGHFTYEEIVKESERLNQKVQNLKSKTNLPEQQNYDLAKKLMLKIYDFYWNKPELVNENTNKKMKIK